MTEATSITAQLPAESRWLTPPALADLCSGEHGSGLDYKLRWGAERATCMSYAPYRDPARTGLGFLYAYCARTRSDLLLGTHVPRRQANAARKSMATAKPNAAVSRDFVAFAPTACDTDSGTTQTDRARPVTRARHVRPSAATAPSL